MNSPEWRKNYLSSKIIQNKAIGYYSNISIIDRKVIWLQRISSERLLKTEDHSRKGYMQVFQRHVMYGYLWSWGTQIRSISSLNGCQ